MHLLIEVIAWAHIIVFYWQYFYDLTMVLCKTKYSTLEQLFGIMRLYNFNSRLGVIIHYAISYEKLFKMSVFKVFWIWRNFVDLCLKNPGDEPKQNLSGLVSVLGLCMYFILILSEMLSININIFILILVKLLLQCCTAPWATILLEWHYRKNKCY